MLAARRSRFGVLLYTHMVARKTNATWLAGALGMTSPARLSEMCCGRREVPLHLLPAIAAALDLTPADAALLRAAAEADAEAMTQRRVVVLLSLPAGTPREVVDLARRLARLFPRLDPLDRAQLAELLDDVERGP